MLNAARSSANAALVETLATAAIDRLGTRRPMLLGLCGAQGSGKSTLAEALAARLTGAGHVTAVLSIDDLYKPKADRLALARALHPLFATRGVPGTHDLDLATIALDRLARGEEALFPRFDKASDDRRPIADWATAPATTEIVILEGWCVGARPMPVTDGAPINALEAGEDKAGRWRRAVAKALAGDYQRLFDRIDLLVLLAAPGFEVVLQWRTEQEKGLRATTGGGMADAAVARFIQHYERLTRHILATMPDYADIVVRLDESRKVRAVERRD